MSDDVKTRLVDELPAATQGARDSQMPRPPEPAYGGEVGPSPTSDALPPGDPAVTGGGKTLEETGETELPGVAEAGGVDARNTDGSAK